VQAYIPMQRFFTLVIASLFGVLLCGCAYSKGTTGRREALKITMPAAGKAKVVFVRPSSYGGAVAFNVHDGDKLIGVLPGNSYFVYECEPGHHLFSSSMEDVAMLDANLLAGRIYYAKVAAVMGWVTAQVNMYSLHPGCAGDLWPKLPKLMRSLRETAVTPEMVGNDSRGAAKYQERIQKYHAEKYLTNPKREEILPEHGQLQPVGSP
jgi:hypothetical protein